MPTLPTPPEDNKITTISRSSATSTYGAIDFKNENQENVKVRVIDFSGSKKVQYYDDKSKEWKLFRLDEWMVTVEQVISLNAKKDEEFTQELKNSLSKNAFDTSSLVDAFTNSFYDGYTKASEVLFNQFRLQTKDKFDAVALRKIYNAVNSKNGVEPVIDLNQREELKKLVTQHVQTCNSQHRQNIATSSVPIDAIKMSLATSLGPRRYQAILGIIRDNCGVSLGDLNEYAGNSDKFKGLEFDHESQQYHPEYSDLINFNQRALAFLDQDNGNHWESLDKFLRNEAYKKDLNRIVEKLKPNDDLKAQIENNLRKIYSGGSIEEPFNQLKIILISERLKRKGLEDSKALELSKRFVLNKESLASLMQDESVKKMDQKNREPKKFEAIFTKYAAFGKISDATQLRKRVIGKILSQFQKKFSEQIHDLDEIQTVEMEGNEILFRGIDNRSGLTEELIKQQFEDLHVGMSTSDGVSQHIGSYKIQREERKDGPGGLGNRASYATATTFDFAVAAKYAGDEGWIYDIRPKKGKIATNLQKLSANYQEIDFEAIDPEEIYAVYKISRTSEENLRRNKIEKVILNPHYKKRERDNFNLLEEKEEIISKEERSQCGSVVFSVTNSKKEFETFNKEQTGLHGKKYAMGSHLREATAKLMQAGRVIEPSPLWQNNQNYNKIFSDADTKAAEITTLPNQDNDALWQAYKTSSNDGWFWGNTNHINPSNNFKVFISVEAEDLDRATEILIKKGYFNYQQLPNCVQKIPSYSEDKIKSRLAIILYAEGDKNAESDAIWTARLNAIEKDFYEAGIKPRPLVSQEKASFGSKANDKKFPGSLYSYYKKDDNSWNWQNDNYFSGIEIDVAKSINKKIEEIKLGIQEAVNNKDLSEQRRLEKLLQSENLYLEISQVGPEKTEYIQSGQGINDDEKISQAEVITLGQSWAAATFRKEVLKMTPERAKYFWANDLRRSANIKTQNADILTATSDAIVNAGNEVLDMGNYGVSGLSKAIHGEFGYKKATINQDTRTGHYFRNEESNLVKTLLNSTSNTEDCEILVGACDKNGNKILEEEQSKDNDGKLLFLDKKNNKLTTEKTEFPYREQVEIKIKAKKLKAGEVVIAEIDSDLNSNSKTKLKSKGVKFIIHAVGPDCRNREFKVLENDNEETANAKITNRKQALENTYRNLLTKALEKGIKKIALPVLSIGVFEYPEAEAAKVIGKVLFDFRSDFEEISIFAIDPKDKNKRPAVLDLIDQNLFQTNFNLMQNNPTPKVKIETESEWKKSSQDTNGTDFSIITPTGDIKASLYSPLMTLNKKNIWYVAEDPDGSLNPNNRANKFKVVDGIYDKEKSDNSEIRNTFINILIKVAAGSEERPKRQSMTKEQVLAIIAKAKERGGISNEANEQGSYLKQATRIENILDISELEAQKFSAAFQKECENCGIYSGRKNGIAVGLRTTFIPDDVVKKFKELSQEEYDDLASRAELNLNQIKNAIKAQPNSI